MVGLIIICLCASIICSAIVYKMKNKDTFTDKQKEIIKNIFNL